jgi:malonyl-CoA O-methyltransferase
LGSTRSTLSDAVIAHSFSKAAAGYDRHARVQAALADWLAEWLPQERPGQALEVGAGTGLFTRHLAGWPGGVTATDLSLAMCSAGRDAVPSADWRVMEAGRPLPGPWALILSSAMLQWVENPVEVFTAWRGVLAPRGRILAGLVVAGSLPEWRAVAGDDAPLTWRTAAEWRAALTGAGLRVLRDETSERGFPHPSARDFLRSLHGIGGAPRRRFSPGVLRQMMRTLEARAGGAHGPGVRATWVFYRVEAEAGDPPVASKENRNNPETSTGLWNR